LLLVLVDTDILELIIPLHNIPELDLEQMVKIQVDLGFRQLVVGTVEQCYLMVLHHKLLKELPHHTMVFFRHKVIPHLIQSLHQLIRIYLVEFVP
jgi:hypothetical protein